MGRRRSGQHHKSDKNSPIDPRLPQWLRELATLLDSGIPAADAFRKSSLMAHPMGRRMAQMLSDGKTLTAAFNRGLFLHAADRVMLHAAEAGGFVPTVLKQLALRAEQRERRQKQMQVRWLLLIAILTIAWLSGLLVAYFSPEQSFVAALFGNTLVCAFMLGMLRCVSGLMAKDSWWWLNTMCRFGRLHHTTGQHLMAAHWLRLVSQQIGAGLDAATALENMVGLLSHALVQISVRQAANLVAEGHSLVDAFMAAHLVSAPSITGPLVAGEHSGQLVDALTRAADMSEAALQDMLAELQAWIPRVLYVFVAIFAISVIF